jgi:hypothetical protein
MKTKGVSYDVGRVLLGRSWRPIFDPRVVRRELEIIQHDLHCNAVRIAGLELDRLQFASEAALEQGLEVWFSPEIWDRAPEDTLEYLVRAAGTAEELLRRHPDRVIFSVGSELTLFAQGYFPGNNVFERLNHPSFGRTLYLGSHNARLNSFLARATEAVRNVFHGRVTYASLDLERVNWDPFDIVGVDLYRDRRNRDAYFDLIRGYRALGKPFANMEFGCCTYQGAGDLGGNGWDILDQSTFPPKLKGEYVYDQNAQARELEDLLRVNDASGVDAAFVYSFVDSAGTGSDERDRRTIEALQFDPDIVRYSLVKSFLDGRHGTAYPDMPWEPKESFRVVADYYANH